MKLRDFLERENISVAEFGRRVGVANRMTILRYVNHERTPPKDIMAAIVRESGGAVRPDDFFDVPPGDAAPSDMAPAAPAESPAPNPATLAAILDQLGGHTVVAEGSGIPVTDLEAMQAEGLVWTQHRAALTGFAREFGGAILDPARLTLRPLGKSSPSWRESP